MIEVTRDRRARTAKGHLLELIMRLAGRRLLAQQLLQAPAIAGAAA